LTTYKNCMFYKLLRQHCEASFLNHFTYILTTTVLQAPSIVHEQLSKSCSQSYCLYPQRQQKGYYSKVNILTTSPVNKVYFTINVFNYLYAGFKNISLEDAETPEAKSLLQYILRYYINAKISTQTHLIDDAGLVWYKDIIPPKALNFNFRVSHIIGAAMSISSMIDAAFDLTDEHQDLPTSTTTPQQNKALDKYAASKMEKPTEHIV